MLNVKTVLLGLLIALQVGLSSCRHACPSDRLRSERLC